MHMQMQPCHAMRVCYAKVTRKREQSRKLKHVREWLCCKRGIIISCVSLSPSLSSEGFYDAIVVGVLEAVCKAGVVVGVGSCVQSGVLLAVGGSRGTFACTS